MITDPDAQATYDRRDAEAAQARDQANAAYPESADNPAQWRTFAKSLGNAGLKTEVAIAHLTTYAQSINQEMLGIEAQMSDPAASAAGSPQRVRYAALQRGLQAIGVIHREQTAYLTRLNAQINDATARGRAPAPYGPPVPKQLQPKRPQPTSMMPTPSGAPTVVLGQTMRPGEESLFAHAAATLQNPRYAGNPAVVARVGQAFAQMLGNARGERA